MNILVIGKFSEDQFGFHISDTLRDMGHITYEFDPTLPYKYSKTTIGRRIHQFNQSIYNLLLNSASFRSKRIKKLSKIFRKNQIDLTISTHDFLYPDEIDLIKEKTKAPVVMWFPDGIGYSNKAFFMISKYDYIFFQDPYAVNRLRSQYNKQNVFYLPECCNPKYHKKTILTADDISKYSCDISTYGNPHNYRSYFFSELVSYNYKIKIWGHQPSIWQNDPIVKYIYMGEYLVNEEKAKSVLAAKINLNSLVPAGIAGLNARAFEIAGIGGFQLIHWREGLKDLFEDGKEIVSFNNFDDLLEKINYYLNNPEERKQIAEASQKRAYSDHTYEKRLLKIFDKVFSSKT